MFLRKLTLQNFKCLAKLELDFEVTATRNRQWTLLLGENGTGKSNLLKAIALITCGSNALGEIVGNLDSWIALGKPSCTIRACLTTKKGEERELALKIRRGDTLSRLISNNQKVLQLIDDAIDNADRNYFVVGYGASRRLVSDAASTMSYSEASRYGSRAGNIRNLFDAGATLHPLAAWIMDLDYRNGKSGLAVIREALNSFLPGISFHSIDKRQKQVLFETSDGLIPLEQLSDGYQNMAAWIGDLLYRVTETFRDHRRPLHARGLLLLDEIDLHLHPKWQRLLYDFISQKLPNFQIVATTHSALTAQQAGEDELFALRRNARQAVELVPFIGSPQQLLVNQLLMSPVFGLATDESREVETAKQKYTQLKAREKTLTTAEQRELANVSNRLADTRPQRNTPLVSDLEMDLLQRIEASLNAR
ncbi:AAA family ATPase [Hymenobacter sp. NST-14]|uniref:AAA family ATPase n=1 Tax=Hymenobacter piscis TaxID=2839984 RepID=UPI001C024737|nr:AAA family ATPase [Hymenobacter piscis]MBT9395048.1 AAA family ATPase [Hymenobacter piscis]